MEGKTFGATTLLAGMLATIPDPGGSGVGAGEFEELTNGVAATIHVPSGDRYRVTVEWIGDEEGS